MMVDPAAAADFGKNGMSTIDTGRHELQSDRVVSSSSSTAATDPFAEAYRMESNSDGRIEDNGKAKGDCGAEFGRGGGGGERAPTLPPLPSSTGLEEFVNGSGGGIGGGIGSGSGSVGGGVGDGKRRSRGFSTGNRDGFEDFDWDGTDDNGGGYFEDIAEREFNERSDRSLVP